MIIVGVDPGSRVTGFGVIRLEGNRLRSLDHGAIRTATLGPLAPFPQRLSQIYQGLSHLLKCHNPDVMAVEEVFHALNVKSALQLGQTRGVVLLAAARLGLPVVEYSPLEVKKAVAGYGRADKRQIQMMVRMLLKLPETPQPHDAADALAIALCHAFRGRFSRGAEASAV